jgi:hypothetical protein
MALLGASRANGFDAGEASPDSDDSERLFQEQQLEGAYQTLDNDKCRVLKWSCSQPKLLTGFQQQSSRAAQQQTSSSWQVQLTRRVQATTCCMTCLLSAKAMQDFTALTTPLIAIYLTDAYRLICRASALQMKVLPAMFL